MVRNVGSVVLDRTTAYTPGAVGTALVGISAKGTNPVKPAASRSARVVVIIGACSLVPVQPVLAGEQGPLEVGLGLVGLGGGNAGAEDAQDAELEVASVGGVKAGEIAQGDVAAVAVAGVGGPAAEDALAAIGFADVELSGAGVGDLDHGEQGEAGAGLGPVHG